MRITFIGAAHEVTGSLTLLELNGRYYLVDCGMEQGVNQFENVPLPVAPSTIEAVFLTHAHIDHSGMLPKLYKDGFRGKIYTTETTRNLCEIMLRDSAHIQMSDAQWRSRKAQRLGNPPVEPIYTVEDAVGALQLFFGCDYGKRYVVGEGVELRFTDVGHLLGSAAVELWLTEAGETRKIVFSGDVGNTNHPMIRDPQTVDTADYLVVESTYGNRSHTEAGDTKAELAAVLQRTFDRGGTVVIPSFAVGRTQELLFALREIKQQGLIKGHSDFPVYVDSPLAEEATAVFLQCDASYFDEETRALLEQGINPIWFKDLRLTVTAEDSKRINEDNTPKVILSASGMCDAGRIRHHLKHNLWKEENCVLFVGYQSSGTLGRKLLDGVQWVRLFGEDVAVAAEIASLHGTSGHADREGLLRWVQAITPKPQCVFVNHGDEEAAETLATILEQTYGYRTLAPYSGMEFNLLTDTVTVTAKGRKINRDSRGGGARARDAYRTLVDLATELLSLARGSEGRSNKELIHRIDQVRNLIRKWKT